MSIEKDKKSSLFDCKRFSEERKRFFRSQSLAAEKCGVTREMWGKYERGEATPGGEVLLAFSSIGADLKYISTGMRTINAIGEEKGEYRKLTKRQEALLDNFDHCSKGVQDAISQMALAASHDGMDGDINQTQKSA